MSQWLRAALFICVALAVCARSRPSPPPTASPAEQSAATPATPVVAPSAPEKPATAGPKLDLQSLEQRLTDTHAIGLFTKLSLKNQVDDLLNDFRGFYAGRIKTTLADLRQRYDLLLLKVLTLLQDSDPSLAAEISASREAIWQFLTDPKKLDNM